MAVFAALLLGNVRAAQLLYLLPALALTAFHSDAAPVRRRPWLIAGAVVLAVMPAVAWASQPTEDGTMWLEWPALCSVAVVAAGAVTLLVNRGWAHPLAVLATAVALTIRTVRAQRRLPDPVWASHG
jgi:hypothetical protein